jgi:Uma2 family endonuclease
MTTSLNLISEDLLYPDDDGNPMSESTEQYRWIVMIKENLELLFTNRADVLIAADLLWYPIQVLTPPAPSQAPDVMVIFGRPKGKRRSYRQWKEANIPPKVVFEILSASNKTREGMEGMEYKFLFYQQHGVEEYYIYDPDEYTLEGWQRQGNQLVEIPQMSGWVSPQLGIQFDWQPRQELVLYRPNGQQFLGFVDLEQRVEQAELQIKRAELQVQQQRSRAEQAEQNLQAAASRLLGFGLGVEEVAATVGLSIDVVQAIADQASS